MRRRPKPHGAGSGTEVCSAGCLRGGASVASGPPPARAARGQQSVRWSRPAGPVPGLRPPLPPLQIARCPCAPTTAEYPFPQIGRPTPPWELQRAEQVWTFSRWVARGSGLSRCKDRFCPRLVNPWAPPRPRGPPFLPFSPPAVKHSPAPRPASSLPSPRARTQPTPFGLEGR